MTFKLTLAVMTLACALSSAQASADAVPSKDGSVSEIYERDIHARPSGVYEIDEWIFFHQRLSCPQGDMMASVRVMGKAVGGVRRAVFAWLDERMEKVDKCADSTLDELRKMGGSFATAKSRVVRTLDEIPSQAMHQGMDDEKPEFVYDLAFRKVDLLKDVSKGRFEIRKETVTRQWKNVVREQLLGKDRMAFVKAAGAFDLWTIDSCKTSGVKGLKLVKGKEDEICKRCIKDLRKSVDKAEGAAADEYRTFLDGLYDRLVRETESLKEFGLTNQVGVMLRSFAACPVAVQPIPGGAWDLISACQDEDAQPAELLAGLLPLLMETPGAVLLWRTTGDVFYKTKSYATALACYRNALRLKSDDALTFDAMARTYDTLGMKLLAKGSALMAYGVAADISECQKTKKILEGLSK